MVFAIACSSEKYGPMNRAYHNTTGHYNAYFYSLEQIKKVEDGIKAAQKPNYDRVLPIFPSIDSTYKETFKAELEECIKKASIVIQYHKNSDWVDDSYNLIGLARMYGYDFPNAIETFKYVNTKGEDVNAKHWALVNLMRTFIENNDMANADAVSDYLDRELLNKNNLKYLYLIRAYYYQKLDQKDNMVRNLVRADPLLHKKERAKLFFTIGQVYQEIGLESSAFDYYKKCIRSNPEYELSFYAKLNMAQVTQLGEKTDLKNIRKYFKKLVKDEKNIDFKDRIYHEWAKFELKQGYLNEALLNFNQSIQSSKNNPRIKGLSYLHLGEIYFDTLKDYSIAQAYYDSAVTTLPKTYEYYETISKRSEILTRFIQQINTITLQDSLLSLSSKDSTELIQMFTAEAERRATIKKQEELKNKKKEAVASFYSFNQEPTGISGGSWYFTNQAAVSKGRTEFKQIWGERALEDHWRRSIKLSTISTNQSNNLTKDDIQYDKSETDNNKSIETTANEFYNKVPKTIEQIEEANKQLEEAYYTLANIYHFELLEDLNAIENYNKLLNKYPSTSHEPEVLYLLYLIESESASFKANGIKSTLFNKYPNSLYSNLIRNPQYIEESNKANEKLEKEYKKVYSLFKEGDYESAHHYINTTISNFPKADFTPNFILLDILILGKTSSLAEYQLALKEFINKYPENKLSEYANKLLEGSNNYKNKLVQLKAAHYSTVVSDDEHFFVEVTNPFSSQTENKIINNIIDSSFENLHLTVGSLDFEEEKVFVIVKTFKNKSEALLFYDTIKAEQNTENIIFVISKLNFEVLYQTKELTTYQHFFESNY